MMERGYNLYWGYMGKFSKLLAFACCLASVVASADEMPGRGKILVATDEVRGLAFAQSVILLLQHDETGTLGLVVNRPIDAAAADALRQQADLGAYQGAFFWGGPVLPYTLRALLRTDAPPENAVRIFADVHLVNIDENLLADTANSPNIRLFVGYAGWGAGQLEYELAFDSWHVLPATEDAVFTEDFGESWRKLSPRRKFRVDGEMTESLGPGRLVSQALF